jgi:hypothetical protein
VPARSSAPAYSPPAPEPPPRSPAPAPATPDQPAAARTPPPATETEFVEPLPPAPPPADYKRELAFRLRPDILVWVAPVATFLNVFVFSFFTWHVVTTADPPAVTLVNLWQLAFGEVSALFLTYLVLLLFLALPVSGACLVFEQRWVPAPPQLAVLMPWKSGLTLVILLLTFLLLFYDYQQGLFTGPPANPVALAEKIAFRLHFLALCACALELWAQSRLARHLPLPRFVLQL